MHDLRAVHAPLLSFEPISMEKLENFLSAPWLIGLCFVVILAISIVRRHSVRAAVSRFVAWMKAVLPRVSQRIGIWIVALFITFLGPFASVHPDWPIADWVRKINADSSFRDLVLATIGITVLAGSNVIDNLIRNYGSVSVLSRIAAPLLLALYFILSCAGVYTYAQAPKMLTEHDFEIAWNTISLILWSAMVTEVLIAGEAS